MTMYGGQEPEQRRGFGGRIFIALIIVLIGWISYMNQVEENPVTGEKQHVAISPKQEIQLGLSSAPEMAKEMGGELPSSDIRAQEVEKIGNFIIANSIAKKSPWQFKFHLLADSKTVNAFALPGGQVFITLGLLNKLQTEAQLAGVLSHEIGHVIERHTAEQMAKSQFGQAVVAAVATAGYDSNQSINANSPAMIAAVVNQMFQLRYSRKDESEADVWGIKLMSEAGFDPKAMIQVMAILKEATKGGVGRMEMFQTHPNPDLRVEQIKAYLAEHPPRPGLKEGRSLQEIFNTKENKPNS